jgi:segregation and condensation protein A
VQTESNLQLAVSFLQFDGPLDLLLSLIRRNEYPIDNLPIVAITGEFLAYVREAESLDMDLGAEFMETASWLVLLKSRSLLPRDAPTEAQQELREAVQKYQLDQEELEKTKKLLSGLRSNRPRVPAAGAASGRRVEEIDEEPPPTAADVVRKVRSAIASARAAASFSIGEAQAATVAEQREWIFEQTARFPAGTALSTDIWFAVQTSTAARASLFLALLELARSGHILIYQARPYAVLLVKALTHDTAVTVPDGFVYGSA